VTRCLGPSCASSATAGPFCELHAKAPAGQRGGWLSAAKRKPYDASAISPRLWVGAKPPFDRDLPNIDLLVLCALELQPERLAFHGRVIRCPIPDAALGPKEAKMAAMASVMVARAVSQGQRVLVTCHMGLNRSALVAALTLGHLTTMNSQQIIDHIRKHRNQKALNNAHFQKMIHRIVGDGRPRSNRRSRESAETEP
jgi:protein-tyrosine phosphatase